MAAVLAREAWPARSTVLIDVGGASTAWLLALAIERLGHAFVVGSITTEPTLPSIVGPDVVIVDRPEISDAVAPIVFRADSAWLKAALQSHPAVPFVRSPVAPDDVIALAQIKVTSPEGAILPANEPGEV